MRGEFAGLSVAELDAERAELLPERAALGMFNLADLWASNQSWALTQYSAFSYNEAKAVQLIYVMQK